MNECLFVSIVLIHKHTYVIMGKIVNKWKIT